MCGPGAVGDDSYIDFMSDLPTALLHQLERLAAPTATDILEARTYIFDVLADGATHHENAMVAQMTRARGVAATAYNHVLVINSVQGGWTDPDPNDPQLAISRVQGAVRAALATLAREGVVVPTEGNHTQTPTIDVNVQRASGSGSITGNTQIRINRDALPASSADCRWRLANAANNPRTQLARINIGSGLEALLGARGAEVLRAAMASFHAGHFIAAADLLAAASEAAWFGVGAAAVGHDEKLDRLVIGGDMVADVIERTTNVIASQKALPTNVRNDVRAQAARFRDLRNYGLHPVGDVDEAREAAFDEPGCAVLFMTAQRYFAHLQDASQALAGQS